MAEVYRNILVCICLGLLIWGVIRIERIYQYPFFMGCMFLSFILPQAFALIANPGTGVSPTVLENVLLVSSICAASCWIGYQMKPNKKLLQLLNIETDERKLFIGGIMLMAEAWFFNFLLSRTTVQVAENYNWTGPATIYLFFIQAGNIAFGIFLLQALKRPRFLNIIFTVISGWPLFNSVLIGRRQPTMTFAIIIGISLFLIYRYVPPRWLVVTGMLLVTFLIPLFGDLRGGVWNLIFSGNWQAILSAVEQSFSSQQKGDFLELRNAALIIDVANKTSLYGFGTGWWDSIVFQFVPGQIVGFDFKKSLQFNLWDTYVIQLKNLYGYIRPNGSTITGVGDCFMEFGYLGCFIYALIAYIFKHLWICGVNYKNTFCQILYMGLISPAMICLTHGVGTFLQQGIFQVIFIGLVTYYSRGKYTLPTKRYKKAR
ncbi:MULTISPECIES: hypothetical protein [unclassified Tolypothrix]|uniref:hypothetical protein n=1 Tax=unclassified Tolypothrix TaxID=2649714 RepID=UPI0005F839FC|nr:MULTISPECIES: hypothetical protein [unclassified Tolypothrix]MBE9081347.1 hypothetical protein [Tolypothrix sp. LEGE 11397]UYD28432.1 hypothetical protein HGR01_10535 [Tolypothrix sp. PCC 7712]UYD35688.1 hypothetical protein HG267_08025 [Tolypothrix sp. PCC 7601]BAY94744.1 hypothetical protein NIES3275_67960 [Microchaete diplosiphon NIES-3275]